MDAAPCGSEKQSGVSPVSRQHVGHVVWGVGWGVTSLYGLGNQLAAIPYTAASKRSLRNAANDFPARAMNVDPIVALREN